MRRLTSIWWLASRDYRREWIMSACFVLALAAVLGPMMVLFGLKSGIIGNMVTELVQDPRNRELRPVASGRHERTWIEQLRQRPDVAFAVPRTRSIAANIQLKRANNPHILDVEVIPSDRGDPLLDVAAPHPDRINEVVLSPGAARKLNVKPGDRVDGSLTRRFRGHKERQHLSLKVVAIAPLGAFARDGLFASVPLVEALEEYRDGRAVPELGWEGDQPRASDRSYPGFRLYAKDIDQVAGLEKLLTGQGIEVRTRAADIQVVQRLDRNLTAVFWVIAIIGIAGFGVSLGASLWANVDRKIKQLAVLRLVGFRTVDIMWFPVTQAIYTAVLGWALASGIYLGVSSAINLMLADQLARGQSVCELLPIHFGIAAAITAFAAMVAAAMAGWRAARIAPSEGLREV